MRWTIALSLLPACSFHASIEPIEPSGNSDGSVANADGNSVGTVDAVRDSTMPLDGPVASNCTTSGIICLAGATATTCNGACWLKCDDPANEFDAVSRCGTWGGTLAPLRSAADESCARFAGHESWTGYTQAIVVTGATVGGNWSWNGDAQPSSYLHWSAGEPNDEDGSEDSGENCANFTTSGSWQDTGCLETYKFSCRR